MDKYLWKDKQQGGSLKKDLRHHQKNIINGEREQREGLAFLARIDMD